MAPWSAPRPNQPWDVLQADGVLQFYPWRDMVFKAWSHGHLPLWNHYELAGTPLLANSQSAAFYPLHILAGVLHLPTPFAMVLLAWVHLFWAGLGVYFLARKLGASHIGALVGAATFELSPFMLAWTALPSVITTVSWIPWVLLGAYRVFHKPDARSVASSALAAGMMLLAGHLQFAAYGCVAAAIVVAGLALDKKAWRPAVLCVAGLVLGGLLAAPQLLPVMSFSQRSHRRNSATSEGYAAYLAGALKPFELANLSIASSLGNPRQPLAIAQGRTISGYWPPFVKPGANFAESAVTVGPLLLGLLFLVNIRDRKLWPLLAISTLGLLLALGTSLNWPLYFLVPGWSSTGSPGRVVVLFVLGVCVIASCALRGEDAKPRSIAIAAIATIVVTWACSFLLTKWATPPQGIENAIGAQALTGPVPIAVLALGCLLRQAARYRIAILVAPLVLALTNLGSDLVMTGKPIDVQPAHDFARTAIINDRWSLFEAAQAYAPPNTAYLLGLHELGGYDSLIDRESVNLLKDVDGQDPSPAANGNMMLVKPSAPSEKLATAGVTHVISTTENGTPNEFRLSGPGRASVEGVPASITAETTQSVRLDATGPGHLVLRDRNMPGWQATVDGVPAPISGTTWRELDLSRGKHVVEFVYVAPGLVVGAWLGLLGWALVAVALGRKSTLRSRG